VEVISAITRRKVKIFITNGSISSMEKAAKSVRDLGTATPGTLPGRQNGAKMIYLVKMHSLEWEDCPIIIDLSTMHY